MINGSAVISIVCKQSMVCSSSIFSMVNRHLIDHFFYPFPVAGPWSWTRAPSHPLRCHPPGSPWRRPRRAPCVPPRRWTTPDVGIHSRHVSEHEELPNQKVSIPQSSSKWFGWGTLVDAIGMCFFARGCCWIYLQTKVWSCCHLVRVGCWLFTTTLAGWKSMNTWLHQPAA